VAFGFERGLDVGTVDGVVHPLPDFLCSGLADLVYPTQPQDVGGDRENRL
jgi:hypothetical protein